MATIPGDVDGQRKIWAGSSPYVEHPERAGCLCEGGLEAGIRMKLEGAIGLTTVPLYVKDHAALAPGEVCEDCGVGVLRREHGRLLILLDDHRYRVDDRGCIVELRNVRVNEAEERNEEEA